MPRTSEQRITAQPQLSQQQTGRSVRGTVAASAADNVPSYIPEMRDQALDGFISGLAKIHPALQQWKQADDEGQAARGALDRQSGKEEQESGGAYKAAYFGTDGLVRGQQAGADLVTKYNTEFDKDKGDVEGWLRETYQTTLQGITDEHYLQGYQKGITPAFQAIRSAHLDYQKKAVETRVESNVMQLLNGGVRAYVTQGMPIPEGYIEAIQDHVGRNLGVSQQRFGELLFDTVRRVGDDGHFEAYDVLKKDRPDGTPGMYFDPAWKQKIDAAELHSFTLSQEMAKKAREQRYNQTLYNVFLEEDPKKAQAMFREAKKSDLFKGDTEGLIKWEKLITEKVDGKPDGIQLDNEVQMLAKIYEGKVTPKDVLNARGNASITSSQGKYLLGEVRRVEHERATLAAAAGKADEAIFKTKEYADAKDYLAAVVQPLPKDPNNFSMRSAQQLEFERTNAAQAQREFFTQLRGKTPADVQPLVEDIAKRYKSRQKEFNEQQQSAVVENKVPFRTLAELKAKAHTLSPSEIRLYTQHLQNQGK